MPFLKTHLLLLCLGLSSLTSSSFANDLKVDIVTRDTTLQPGSSAWIAVKIQIPEGTHIYGGGPDSMGLPTTVEWILPTGLQASPIYWPPTEHFSVGNLSGDGYQDTIVLPAELTVDATVAPTNALHLEAKVSWLACSDMCIPGSTVVCATIPVREHAPIENPLTKDYFSRVDAAPPAHTPWKILFLAFIGGILLNFMPCVFPILGIKILSFVEHSKGSAARVRAHGHMFTLGVLLSFWALAAVLIGLREAGTSLGWGFQLQSPACIMFLMALFFVMGLGLMGVFEMGLSFTRVGIDMPSHNSVVGSFMSGIVATLVATPCTGPFMGVALGVALGQSYAVAWAIFTALAVGMAAPYWLLSMCPQWIKLLPKPGAWMEALKQIMAFPLFATVVWLGWVLGLQTSVGTLAQTSFGLLLLAFAVWIWGRWSPAHYTLNTRRWSMIAALLFFAIGVGSMAQALCHCCDTNNGSSTALKSSPNKSIDWQPWEAARVNQLRTEGKIVFVDFTAAWCLTCQANRQTSLENHQVAQAFHKLGVVAMEADWTRRDAAITEALTSFGRSGVPLNVIYPPDPYADPIILPQILTPSIIIDALSAASNP